MNKEMIGAVDDRPGLLASAVRSVIVWADRHTALVLFLLAALMVVLGVLKLWLDRPSFEFNWENRWWQIALNLARGEGYVSCKEIYFPFCGPTNQATAMREPLPVLLFALIARLTNESLLMAAASGVIANVAVMVGLFYLGREVANRLVGLLAAVLWAAYFAPVRLFYAQVSGDLLAAVCLTWGMVYFYRARRGGRPVDWLVAGVLLGLAALSRSAVLVVALALTAGLFLWPTERTLLARRVRLAAFFALAFLVTISPWIIRNYLVFDRPVIGSTLAGYYLYRQSSTLPTDDYLRFVSGGEFLPALQEMVARRPDLQGNENEAQMDAVYRQEGLRLIRAEPGRYLNLSLYRFLMLWFNWRVNEVYGKANAAGDFLIIVQHLFFLVTGVIGLRGRWRQVWPLVVALVAWNALYMAVMAHLPYIVSIVPLLVILSALALLDAGRWLYSPNSLTLRRFRTFARLPSTDNG
jgi:4-amino-4-deoxy-L-arabinose transferase-like glycosyltransferase